MVQYVGHTVCTVPYVLLSDLNRACFDLELPFPYTGFTLESAGVFSIPCCNYLTAFCSIDDDNK